MLQTLSKYIFFVLIFSFFSILFLSYFSKDFSLNNNFIYLFWILILVFFDKIIEFIKKEDFSFYFKNLDFEKDKKNLFIRIFLLIFFTILLLFLELEIINFLILEFIIFSIFFKLDSRISFSIALVLLCYTIFFIFFEDKKMSEILSIYAYYFLIIWVWLEIFQNLLSKKQIKNEK